MKPAIFLDKDGTLIHDVPYNVDPDRITLREDAGPALARLHEAGFQLVVVSNQPGVARGLYPETALPPVWQRLERDLAPFGVKVEAFYHCPHHPEGLNPLYTYHCECRKPRPAMLLRAALEHDIDLAQSWMVGDILDDVEAGRRAGCRTVLLDVGSETEWRRGASRKPHARVPTLTEAAEYILSNPWQPGDPPWTQ